MRSRILWFTLGAAAAVLILWGLYQMPPVRERVEWRLDVAAAIVRGWLHPGDTLPAPERANTAVISSLLPPTASKTPVPDAATPTPVSTPTPLPEVVLLDPPAWEKQDWNNCGPATLALGLRYYGWEGDQYDISDLIKPDRGDRNVNIDELAYYVRTRAGWLGVQFRVNGTVDLLKRFLAAGFPMIIEKGYVIESSGPDAGWAGHYLLLTGYEDARRIFIAQDTFTGADEEVSYEALDEGWQAFNRVFMAIYPMDQQDSVNRLLGPDVDEVDNRNAALDTARAEVVEDSENAFAWFNVGMNMLYFEQYEPAAQAFDTALSLGLPWRFTRYQFGPYIAYFNQGRYQDVIDLANATLQRTNKAEESMLWRGWARYQLGDLFGAIEDFRAALKVNPNYLDAQYALDFVGATP